MSQIPPMSQTPLITVILLSMSFTLTGPAFGQWASVTGTFQYDGKAPVFKPIIPNKDPQFCGKQNIPDERLLVNSATKGIANVVIYLRKKPSKISPEYDKKANAQVNVDNALCRFEPHVQTVRTTQMLVLGNKDAIGHNTNVSMFKNPSFNQLIPALGNIKKKLSASERVPIKIACNIHPWMSAILVIKDHPYVAVTDANGEFMIPKLPAGKLTIQFWQERTGYVENVTIGGKKTKLRRGRIELTIKDNESLDLGTIQVGSDELK